MAPTAALPLMDEKRRSVPLKFEERAILPMATLEIEPRWSVWPKDAGWVYLIECNGLYKIGRAKDVGKRLDSLQVGSPYTLKLIAKYFADEFIAGQEQDLQDYFLEPPFNCSRIRGEWFKLTPEAVEHFSYMADMSIRCMRGSEREGVA